MGASCTIPTRMPPPQRTQIEGNPAGLYLHDAVLSACQKFAQKTALVDSSNGRRISYAEYGELVESVAHGMVAAGVRPGEMVGIYLPNAWEFCVTFHAATLAGAIPTPLNPSYREREVRYQLENSGAVLLVTDGPLVGEMNLGGLPKLRRVYATRATAGAASEAFSTLLASSRTRLPQPQQGTEETLAVVPYSSGTTGLPKGVMLTHYNLVANVFQSLAAIGLGDEVVSCFLPLYHIYGLNVVLNAPLMQGETVVLMPRFDLDRLLQLIAQEGITWMPLVPPVLNALCLAAEAGKFPRDSRLRSVMSGAAPLAPELAHRFTRLTGIRARQGYGMTEASPVTHCGMLEDPWYLPASIGLPVALTDCRVVGEHDEDLSAGGVGELVMRGPQIMLGYWQAPEATAAALRDGWYWSGDVARVDEDGFFFIVDRRKEMIKYKGFPIAPAEVEAVLLENPLVKDCGVVGVPDAEAGEAPSAFIVLRDGSPGSEKSAEQLRGYVAERLTAYKKPRDVHFVANIPRNPSGKILRRELRKLL